LIVRKSQIITYQLTASFIALATFVILKDKSAVIKGTEFVMNGELGSISGD